MSPRISATVMFCTLAFGAGLIAQEVERPSGLCFRARPRPRCQAFFITNAGTYVTPSARSGETPFRGIIDWGFMSNSGPGHAFGVSWFVSLDKDEWAMGPVLRYRRWLAGERSLEVALATPVSRGQIQPGSVLALVKYNPVRWGGVGLRPELIRARSFTCGTTCTERTVYSGRVYAGIEVGEVAGLSLSIGGGVGVLLLALALAGSD